MPLGAGESVWRDPGSSPLTCSYPYHRSSLPPRIQPVDVSPRTTSRLLIPCRIVLTIARRTWSHGSASHGVCSTPAWVPPGNARSATRHATWIPRWSPPWNAPSSWVSHIIHTHRDKHITTTSAPMLHSCLFAPFSIMSCAALHRHLRWFCTVFESF
jgi:hypothetical protein